MEKPSIQKALVAETIGTFTLVFSIIFAVSMYALQADVARGLTYPFIALAHGFALFIMIQTLGSISGGHFNPAVTLGLMSIKKISPGDAAAYIAAQIFGAVLAAFVIAILIHSQAHTVSFATAQINHKEITLASGAVLEGLAAFFLVWTVVGTAVNPNGPKEWAPAAIATSLALGVLLIAPLTGASINPARAIGPALVNAIDSGNFQSATDFIVAYIIAPIAGGVIAAQLYSYFYLKSETPVSPAPSEQSPF